MKTLSIPGVGLRLHSLLVLFLLCVLLTLIGGCLGGGLDEQFVKAVDSNWKVMGQDYRGYVQGDGALSEASKNRRLKAIDEFSELVKEAKAKVDK